MTTTSIPTANPQYLPPDFSEFISRRMRDVAANMNCCLIGEVLAIQYLGQYPTVTVAVNFQKILKGLVPIAGGIADQTIDYPNLVNVPLFIYQGGGAALTMPIQSRVVNAQGAITTYGDMAVIFFCDRDMDIWFQTGQVAPPNSDRVHNINDAIAFVGLRNILNAVANFNPSIASLSDNSGERLTQAGMMMGWPTVTPPSGFLLCDGSAVSRTTYANLFAVCGTQYGVGDGTTTFNLPDGRGKNLVAFLSGDTNFGTIGGKGGEATHLLTGPESGIQSHSHTIPVNAGGSGEIIPTYVNQSATTPASVPTGTTGPTNAASAHNNVQPFQTIGGVIIKY